MAKRMKSKIQPSELTLTFQLKGGTEYIDLSQCASIVNRRFYRQGLNWAVSDFKFIFAEQPTSGNASVLSINRLPNTWVMSNAWEKSFRAWQKMNNEALDESPSVKPKFLDFKIYADNEHHNAGFAANLTPSTNTINYLGNANYATGEWLSSKVSIPVTTPAGVIDVGQTNQFEFIAIGPSYPGALGPSGLDAVSLIEGYAASRGLPYSEDPNTPGDAMDTGGGSPENWISAMFNEGTNRDKDVLEDMITENNQAPYPFEGDGTNTDTMYPGGANNASGLIRHDSAYLSSTTVGGVTHLKGGNFPCGLLQINSGDLESGILQISLVPGTHRGYLAESMTEM